MLLVAGVTSSFAAKPQTPYVSSAVEGRQQQDRARWGERLAGAGDLSGDRINDLVVAVPMEDVAGVTDAGRVYVLSGRDRTELYALDSPEPQQAAKFGFFINVLGDVDGDRRSDIAVGTDAQDVYTGTGPPCGAPEPNGCNEDQGKAWVFSGRRGTLIYGLDNPAPQSRARFGSRIGRAGDVNGDRRPDVIAGASANDVPAGCGEQQPIANGCRRDQGQAFIFNGRNGKLIRTLDMPARDRHLTP